MEAHPILSLDKLLRVPYVDEHFDPSPDGAEVAFSWNRTGQWEVYLVPTDGGLPPRQATEGPGAKHAPRWSPDGRRLAYALDLDGSEQYDIWLYDRETARHVNLTPGTPELIDPSFAWSPDGRHIALISNRAGRMDTYVLPVDGGPPRPALTLPYSDLAVVWSPDGEHLAVVCMTRGQDTGIFVVPAEGGEPRPVAGPAGPLCAKHPAWSPDGSRLACVAERDGCFQVALWDRASGDLYWLTDGEGDRDHPAWSPDGSRLAWVHSRGPVNWLEVADLSSGQVRSYQVEPGVHAFPRFTPDGNGLLFVFDNPRRPPDLWLLHLPDGRLRQLTHSLPPDLQDAPFVMPEEVRYPSLDGQGVPALLYRPRARGHLRRSSTSTAARRGWPRSPGTRWSSTWSAGGGWCWPPTTGAPRATDGSGNWPTALTWAEAMPATSWPAPTTWSGRVWRTPRASRSPAPVTAAT